MKCFITLEMLNFSLNFLFYILCSPTSRKEFSLIMYYFFYWRWSKEARTTSICSHPSHNAHASNKNGGTGIDQNLKFYKFAGGKQEKARLKIYCFLANSTRPPATPKITTRPSHVTYASLTSTSHICTSHKNSCNGVLNNDANSNDKHIKPIVQKSISILLKKKTVIDEEAVTNPMADDTLAIPINRFNNEGVTSDECNSSMASTEAI